MPRTSIALLSVFALLQSLPQCYAGGYTKYTGFPGDTDPSNYMFYDPTEQCKDVEGACILSFKFCSHTKSNTGSGLYNFTCPPNAKQGDLSWGPSGGNGNFWVEDEGAPQAVYDSFANYTLKWMNNKPEYPTTVRWRPYFFTDWENYYMYQVVDAGKDSFEFSFQNLSTQMLPGTMVPANGSTEFEHNMTRIITDFASLAPLMYFEIGQPEDPKSASQTAWSRNTTDRTGPFRLDFLDAEKQYFAQEDSRGYLGQVKHDLNKRWGLGVGIGVGLGFPLLMLISFVAGRKTGTKKAKSKFSKNMPLE